MIIINVALKLLPLFLTQEVKPGDPPFPGAGLQDDKDEDEYKPKEKKKTQIANLMKKPEFVSACSTTLLYLDGTSRTIN